MIGVLTCFLALYFVESRQQQQNLIKCNKLNVGKYYLNECERRCECMQHNISGQQRFNITCFKERENYACMSSERRQRFHQAIITISNPTHHLYNNMKDFIQIHSD